MDRTVIDANLGIDWGSTSTRAWLLPAGDRRGMAVHNQDRRHDRNRYEVGDFPSTIQPFDGQEPVYSAGKVDPGRDSISSKKVVYPLVDASAELLEQYPLLAEHLEQMEKSVVRRRMLRGIIEMFKEVKRHVHQVCDVRRLRVQAITLSIPSQWHLRFEEFYRLLIARVFEFQPELIYFVTETHAMAHLLCRDHLPLIIRQPDVAHHDRLLFLDFGGHNLNACTFNVVYGGNTPSFYLVGDAEGRGGGSEQWEYKIGERIVRIIELEKRHRLSCQERQRILDKFNREKSMHSDPIEQARGFSFQEQTDDGKLLSVHLCAEKVNECFDAALAEPLELAGERIRELSLQTTIRPRVVISGGTSRHEGLRAELRDLCVKNGLSPPVFTDTLNVVYDSARIAQGAAYTTEQALSVEEFLGRGAAIGLQIMQRSTHGRPNEECIWDDTATLLLNKNGSKAFTAFCQLDHWKLICDPFFDEHSPQSDELQSDVCYDLLELGQPSRGNWKISLNLLGHGNNMALTVARFKGPHKKGVARSYKLFDQHTWLLHYNKAANCVLLGLDGQTKEDLLKDFKRWPRLKTMAKGQSRVEIPEESRNGAVMDRDWKDVTEPAEQPDEPDGSESDETSGEFETRSDLHSRLGDEDDEAQRNFQFSFDSEDSIGRERMLSRLGRTSRDHSASPTSSLGKRQRRISFRVVKRTRPWEEQITD